MPSLDVRLRLVRKLPQPAQIAALESALTVAGSTEGGEIALQLLDIAATEKPFLIADGGGGLFRRRRKPAQAIRPLLALLRAWSILGEDERAAAVAIAGQNIAAVLELMADDRHFAHRLAAAKIAASHPSAETIPILSRLIIDTDDDVQTAAETAIEQVSQALGQLDQQTVDALDRLLADAGRTFSDHRKPGVISAIASQLGRPGPRLAQWLLDEHQAGLLALRGLLRRDKTPGTAMAAVRMLNHPTLQGAARTRLENLTTPRARNAALSQWPFLLDPVCARSLSTLRRPDLIFPNDNEAAGLDTETRIGVCVWATVMRLRPADRAHRLTRIALGDDRRSALAAVRRLATMPRPDAEARSGLFQATTVEHEKLATFAASALLDDRSPAARNWMQGLHSSPRGGVRAVAGLSNHRFNPWAWVTGCDPLGNAFAAQRALKNDRGATIDRVRELIQRGETPQRIRAMRLAWRLRIDAEVELELLKSLTERDTKIVASAVLSLRRLPTSAAHSALLACVDHADPRVAANAIEALAWRRPDHPRVRMASDHAIARTRANALRAGLATTNDRDAQRRLQAMLEDRRPEHRVSALWVAQRTGQTGLSRVIAKLLLDETDQRVIARGQRCARLLLAQLRLRDGAVIERAGARESSRRRLDRLEELK
jgi:hypothetical protein